MGSFQSIKTTIPLCKKDHIYSNNGNPQPCVAVSWVTKGHIKAKAATCVDPSWGFTFPVSDAEAKEWVFKTPHCCLTLILSSERKNGKSLLKENISFVHSSLDQNFCEHDPGQEKSGKGGGYKNKAVEVWGLGDMGTMWILPHVRLSCSSSLPPFPPFLSLYRF